MFKIKIPFAENLSTQNEKLSIREYHLFSSIFEPAPRLSITLNTSYETPDVLKTFLGTSFPIKYVIEELEEEKEDEEGSNTTTKTFSAGGKKVDSIVENGVRKYDPVDLIGMFVSQIEMQNEGTETSVTLTCDSDFLAYQRSDIRKAYINEFGDKIVEDLIQENQVLQNYDTDISKTDNTSVVYRHLGESDIDLLKDTLGKFFLIAGGQPLFYIGLDKKATFTSVSKLLSNLQKTNLLVRASGSTTDNLSNKTESEILGNYVDLENYIELPATNWKFTIGKNNSIFNLKTAAYYSDSYVGSNNTTKYTFKPATDKKTYYPIDNIFMNFIDEKQCVQVYNRSSSEICYEAKNYFSSFEDLCTVKVTLSNAEKLNKLYTAGETVTFISPYPYSIYNGNYLIAEIEYGQKESIAFVEMVLIRPQIDPVWAEKMTINKNSQDFKFPLAPELDKSLLYSL